MNECMNVNGYRMETESVSAGFELARGRDAVTPPLPPPMGDSSRTLASPGGGDEDTYWEGGQDDTGARPA